MKKLEKLMTHKELLSYLETHPKYSIADSNMSPFTSNMETIDSFSFRDLNSKAVYSRLIQFPVYVEYSQQYLDDKKYLEEQFKDYQTVTDFIGKYL